MKKRFLFFTERHNATTSIPIKSIAKITCSPGEKNCSIKTKDGDYYQTKNSMEELLIQINN